MTIFSDEVCLKRVTTLLKAVANEKRLKILCVLSNGEKSVGALEEMVDLSQSALSQHLARLRRDEIVKTKRDAQTIYYSIDDKDVIDLVQHACKIIHSHQN